MNLEYHTKISQKTWTVESDDPARKITCGFWIKETIDRPLGARIDAALEPRKHSTPASSPRNRFSPFERPPRGDHGVELLQIGFNDDYEALSYVWGEETGTAVIHLDGYTIGITKSREAALLNIRSERAIKPLWIDQVCINQADIKERSSQVEEMPRVYAAAERVRIWLGTSTEHSKVGIMVLQQLCDDRSLGGEPSWKELPSAMVRTGIKDIMNRDWLKRTWVVQEAAVAKEVIMHCGPDQFSWQNKIEQVRFFSRAIKMAALAAAYAQTELIEVDMEPMLQVLERQFMKNHAYRTIPPAPDLLDIAYEMRNRATGDPRDRVYAILGFANYETREHLVPDYAIKVDELWKRFEEVLLYLKPAAPLPRRIPNGCQIDVLRSCETSKSDRLERSGDVLKIPSDESKTFISSWRSNENKITEATIDVFMSNDWFLDTLW